MDDGEDDADLVAQLQQQAQQRDGINTTGDGDANAVSGMQQLLPSEVFQ